MIVWLASNVIGLPGKRGTNTPTYVRAVDGKDKNGIEPQRVHLTAKPPYRTDFDEHLVKPDRNKSGGYARDDAGGLKGGHNATEFETAMENPGSILPHHMNNPEKVHHPDDVKGVVLDRKPVLDAKGNKVGEEITYKTPKVTLGGVAYENGKVVYGTDKDGNYPKKTVYYPDKISDADYNAAAKRASQVAWDAKAQEYFNEQVAVRSERGTGAIDPQTGLKFLVYFDHIGGVPGVANAFIINYK